MNEDREKNDCPCGEADDVVIELPFFGKWRLAERCRGQGLIVGRATSCVRSQRTRPDLVRRKRANMIAAGIAVLAIHLLLEVWRVGTMTAVCGVMP